VPQARVLDRLHLSLSITITASTPCCLRSEAKVNAAESACSSVECTEMVRPSCETDQMSSPVRITTIRSKRVAPLETTLKLRYPMLFNNKLKGIGARFRIALK
jgi:hypothetical protein